MDQKPVYTDQELIKGCLSNDRIWQERLYKKYFKEIHAQCNNYASDHDECMLLINNAYLRVFQKLALYNYQSSLISWMRQLTKNVALNYLQSKKSKPVFQEINNGLTIAGKNDEEIDFDFSICLDQLPPATRQVFQLFNQEGYSHREISERLMITIGTSKWHLSNARKILQQFIQTDHAKK